MGSETESKPRHAKSKAARTHRDLLVYERAFAASMEVFQLSKAFPKEEVYALTDQIRRSTRSVCATIAEAWRKRRYKPALISKLTDAEAEAAETQVWIEYAVKCGYLARDTGARLYREYDRTLATLVGMTQNADSWVLKTPATPTTR